MLLPPSAVQLIKTLQPSGAKDLIACISQGLKIASYRTYVFVFIHWGFDACQNILPLQT